VLDHRGQLKYPTWLSWDVLCCDQCWSLFEPQCFWLKRMRNPGRGSHYFALSINFSQRNWMPLRNLCKELVSSFWSQNTRMKYSLTLHLHPITALRHERLGKLGTPPKHVISGHELSFQWVLLAGWTLEMACTCTLQLTVPRGHPDGWQLNCLHTWKPRRSSRPRFHHSLQMSIEFNLDGKNPFSQCGLIPNVKTMKIPFYPVPSHPVWKTWVSSLLTACVKSVARLW